MPQRRWAVSLKAAKKLPRVLTLEQVQALLDSCEHLRDRLLLAMLYDTGDVLRGSSLGTGLCSGVGAGQEADSGTLACATGVVRERRSACYRRGVELGDELAVGGAGGGEVLVAFFELQTQVDDLLFEHVNAWLKWSMSVGAPRPDSRQACSPSSSDRRFSSWRTCGRASRRRVRGCEQVGLQRGAGDGRSGCVRRRWCGLGGVDLVEQVAVPVEEGAVDAGFSELRMALRP